MYIRPHRGDAGRGPRAPAAGAPPATARLYNEVSDWDVDELYGVADHAHGQEADTHSADDLQELALVGLVALGQEGRAVLEKLQWSVGKLLEVVVVLGHLGSGRCRGARVGVSAM